MNNELNNENNNNQETNNVQNNEPQLLEPNTTKNKVLGTIMIILILVVIALSAYLVIYLKDNKKEEKPIEAPIEHKEEKFNEEIVSLGTETTNLEDNTIWAPTLQIIWNDFINEDNKTDVVFEEDPNNELAKLLNKQSFKSTDISDSYLYHKFGFATPALKEEIKKGIKDKFNQSSEILDNFTFEENSKTRFFYSMLYKEFTFKNPFDILNENTFGIDKHSDRKLNSNVEVIYYTLGTYAVKLLTNEGDEVILYKGERDKSFIDTYNKVMSLQIENKEFTNTDFLTVHNIDFKAESKYEELTKKEFKDSKGDKHIISAIEQITSMSLNNEGGKVKSEAGMSVDSMAIMDSRDFIFLDDFMIFVKEAKSNKPYFAANISNIEKFTK